MKQDNIKVCIISVYFGNFPDWFFLWINSVEKNPTVDFLLVTDQFIDVGLSNLKIITMDLNEFKLLAEDKLGMKIKLSTSYKLCDYKEVWGVILSDYVKNYDYWGETDIDLIYGDLRYFFDKYKLSEYEKFGNRGHFSLYKNIPEVNNRYKLSGGWFGSYKEVFSSNRNWAFDETPGINAIYHFNNLDYMDKFIYADIDVRYKDVRLVEREDDSYKNYPKQFFYWDNGKVIRKYINNDAIFEDEFMYIHLQKRQMSITNLRNDIDKYVILGDEFLSYNDNQLEDIFMLNRQSEDLKCKKFGGKYKKDLRFFWVGRRILNVMHDIKHFFTN